MSSMEGQFVKKYSIKEIRKLWKNQIAQKTMNMQKTKLSKNGLFQVYKFCLSDEIF